MAHELNYNEKLNRHSMVSAIKTPWHGLGKVVDGAMTSNECIKLAGLDYDVVKTPNCARIPNDWINPDSVVSHIVNPASFSTVRTDTNQILGTVGKDYTVVQNLSAFEFFDDITKAKEAMFETAGALGKGETIFISAKLPNYIKVNDKDIVESYLLFFNTHDGSRSIEVMFTPVRVVCNNTLTYARKTAANKYRIRHTKSVHDRLNQANEILGIQNKLFANASEVYKAMSKVKITDDTFRRYVDKIYLTDQEFLAIDNGDTPSDVVSTRKINVIKDIYNYYDNGVGQDIAKGTLWGAYNAITGYYQNTKTYSSPDAKLLNITNGDVFNKNVKAFDLAVNIFENV